MPLVNRAPIDASGNLLVTTVVPTAAWPQLGGMTYDPVTGALAVIDAVPAANDPYVGGIRFTNVGQMYVWSQAAPAGVEYVGGIPVTDDGRMVVNGAGGGGSIVVGGWPISGSGGVPVTGLAAQPIFFAPLQSTLVPTVAGNPAFTFTRATLAYALDQDNVLRQAQGNEARFQGARRVRNLFLFSEGGTWNPPSGGSVVIQAYGGKSNVVALTFPAGTVGLGQGGSSGGGSLIINNLYNLSISAALSRPLTGTESIGFWVAGGVGYNGPMFVFTSSLQPGAALTRFGLPAGVASPVTGTTGLFVYPQVALTSPLTVYVWGWQLEDVTSQSNQAPSEYVSVGVLSAPYYGTGVDGVKYFQTTNGNSLPVNLLLQSQTFDNASWVKQTCTVVPNTITAPDGSLTADTVTATSSNSFLTQLVSVTAVPYTFSIYLKRLSGTGPISITDGSSTVNVASQINSSTWTRVSGVITPAFGNRSWGLKLDINTDAVYAWGAQLEPGSGPPSLYTPTTATAFPATNVVTEATGAAIPQATLLGYVAENAATNIVLQSQTFDTIWQPTNATVTANTQAAPDGTLTADTLADNATNGFHFLQQGSVNLTAVPYTFSIYAKAGTLPWIQVILYDGAAKWANFNLTTGAAGNKAAGVTTASQALPNGWWRFSITTTPTATAAGIAQVLSLLSDINAYAPVYVGTGQTMYLWGAQVEQASDVSSYIPTTAAATTRNFDNLQYPMVSNLDGALATTYTETYLPVAVAGAQQIVLSPVSSGGYAQYFEAAKQLALYPGGSSVITANARNLAAVNKGASAWSGATASVCLNGGAVATGAFIAFLNSGNVLVGNYSVGNLALRGYIRNVKFYATRLTNVELQGLTT